MASKLPEILVLSLLFQPALEATFSSLFKSLNSLSGSVKVIERLSSDPAMLEVHAAMLYLETHTPKAIIVTDGGLTEEKNRAVLNMVQRFIINGGLVIFGLHFSSPMYTRKEDFEKFFEDFGLPWKQGDCHRAPFRFNPSCTLPAGVRTASFPLPYNMRVRNVKNAEEQQKIFIPLRGGLTVSRDSKPSRVDETQAAIVGAKIGEGFLVYVGDYLGEKSSDEVVLTLLSAVLYGSTMVNPLLIDG